MNPPGRKAPGTRPAAQVTSEEPPNDWLCTWSCRAGADGIRYWELKYIHAACCEHNKLQAA